jgi:hypothetical protein
MAGDVHELRPKTGDSEKITINLGYVDLGHIEVRLRRGWCWNSGRGLRLGKVLLQPCDLIR